MPAMTKLEAVNESLRAIGETPVNSLSSGVIEASEALARLERTTKEVLSKGWHANTDYDYRLLPDTSGEIPVPASALSVDPVDASVDYVVRGGKLYDRANQTFAIAKTVLVDIKHALDFEDLPFALAAYISARSARLFQESIEGSVALDSFIARREGEMKALAEDAESEQDDANVLRDSPSVHAITFRYNRLQGV